jgi:hypothetical protein
MKRVRRLCATASVVLAMCGSYAAAAPAQEQHPSFAPMCAEREVQVITLLEDLAGTDAVPSDTLGDAGLTRMQARTVCYQKRVAEAVAMYDGIIARLAPVLARAASQP